MEQLNFMPMSVSKQIWENWISALMNEMKDNESAIIEVAQDASIMDSSINILKTCPQYSKRKIKKRSCYVGLDRRRDCQTYFRLKDFENF